MASGTRSQVRAAGLDVRTYEERLREKVLRIRRGDISCNHDDMKPEDLPAPAQGEYEEMYENGRYFYPTVEEQWPSEIPECLAPLNLSQYKAELVHPGNQFYIPPTHCGYCMLEEVHKRQLDMAVELWTREHTAEELRAIPPEAIGPYRY